MVEQLDLFAARPAAPVAAAPQSPPDQPARDRVRTALDTTLFVEAGAGSGKTSSLVGRVVELVLDGVPIGSIAAITFTEKAAAELRHRIRAELISRSASDGDVASAAVADLDLAPIGTLHAFARRLLSEFPVEAALPPRFDVLDEVQSATAFHERFTDFLEALLDDPSSVRLVELCEYDGFGIEKGSRRMADDFQANWDLVEARVRDELPPAVDDAAVRGQVRDACIAVAAFEAPEGDTQEKTIEMHARWASAFGGDIPLAELLRQLAAVRDRRAQGDARKWEKHHGDPGVLARFKEHVAVAQQIADTALAAFEEERRLTLGALVRRFTLDSVAQRQADGALEFHDLLVLARRLVAEQPVVRARMHDRYTRVLLDEFQDTDPIQLELAVRITASPELDGDWRELRPLPGRLTVVGDPKQSIYRFRRADIAQFLRARSQLDAEPATLTANFRSARPVIDWINHTMSKLIVEQTDVQPPYVALAAAREGAHDHGTVTVLGAVAHSDLGRAAAETLREREAADVAVAVVTALENQWPVWRQDDDSATPRLEPCRPGDIAILLPSRLSLPALQAALAARGIPFRAENSSLVYAAPEVRAMMLALRAADDPTDELALVSAMRTPLFGCSDRHLYEWRVVHGRRWNWRHLPAADADDPAERDLAAHPVVAALACLSELSARIPYQTPSQLLSWLATQRCVLELALTGRDSRDVWRRVRFVIDQARAWSEAGGHGVRRYLIWTRLQGDEGRFVAETVLPETDHDVVRLMTVHAAKGLEFPITIVSGLTAQQRRNHGRGVIWFGDTWGLNERSDPTYEQFAPVDEQMSDAERKRLLYVACTRAQDHLVVSLHRDANGPASTAAAQLEAAAAGAVHKTFEPVDLVLTPHAVLTRELPWADEADWWRAWQADLAVATRPAALSATTLAARHAAHTGAANDPGIEKDPVDLDLPPWQRGRYGTAVGRAVHAVLQFALPDHDLSALAASQAAAEGIIGHERTIEQLARSALMAPIVTAGMRGEHWRELFVAVEFDGSVVEGYIDLLVRTPDGLVVVDYKTDQIPTGTERQARLQRYGVQLAAYGLALEQLLGEPVAGGVLVMCRPRGAAEEVPIDDWDAQKSALRERLVAG